MWPFFWDLEWLNVFYLAHISKWQEVLGSFVSIKKKWFLILFSMYLNLFFIFPISFLFRFNFDNFFSLFSKSLFQWPWLICYWTFYWIFNFNYGISHLQVLLFFLKSACCLITISKLSSIYWNIFNILFHIVVPPWFWYLKSFEDLVLLFILLAFAHFLCVFV